jgi:catechol 2,3-dioxygenase-like lactoylglutathione lyase family enzyme
MTAIRKLHHAAYRCRDSEETRAFYEDFLGLPMTHALRIDLTQSGRGADVLHTFFAMADGSCLAFFEEPGEPFEFKAQRDFDLHIALEVSQETLVEMFEKGPAAGVETRGVSDHGFIDSIYFRDPNGYVVELAAPKTDTAASETRDAHELLADWQAAKV